MGHGEQEMAVSGRVVFAGAASRSWRASWLGLVAVAWAMSGCLGSETGNAQVHRPTQTVAFGLSLAPESQDVPVAQSRDRYALVAEEGRAQVESIALQLAAGEHCATTVSEAEAVGGFVHEWCVDDALIVEGAWQVDLLSGRFEPPLVALQVPEAKYSEVRVNLRTGAEPELVLFGQISGGAGTRPFSLPFRGIATAKFVAEEPVTIEAGLGGLVLDLVYEEWFSGLDLGPCFAASPDAERLDLSSASPCLAVVNAARNHIANQGVLDVR